MMRATTIGLMVMACLFSGCGGVDVDEIDSPDPTTDYYQPPPCDDGNECTKDALVNGHCAHFNYTNMQTCGDGGRCNGNVTPAVCCEGCMAFTRSGVVCIAQCPSGRTCGGDGFCS